jgi:hypothetical protein
VFKLPGEIAQEDPSYSSVVVAKPVPVVPPKTKLAV